MNINPKRGEIWWVEFDPQVGEEIKKTRPAVVLSISAVEAAPTRFIVPIREFKDYHDQTSFFITLKSDKSNGLKKKCSADCNQAKSVSLKRFSTKLGILKKEETKMIAKAVAYISGYLEDQEIIRG